MAAEVAAVHSSNELLAMVEHHWPNSGWVPEPARPGNGGGSAAPAGPGPTGHATRLSAWSSTTANRTGPLATHRQRPRRRITPNTNTSTTTMISTHNHVDMAASFGRRRPVRGDATAAHPSKQLDHSQATSWARIDGRATPGPTGPSAPRDLPADLDWPGEGQPGSRPRARLGPSPRAMPSRPALPPHLAPTTGGPGQASPTRRDHREPDRAGMTRPRRVCPAWVREPCEHGCAETQWQTPRRRRRPDGPCLRRNPNLRRGRLHGPALQVQPRSALRDPPRVGPAGGDSATATPPLSCRGPMSAQLGTAPACPHPPARPRRG
jgi:hypothetical protein